MKTTDLFFDIATVERETGIGKDTLRVWEKRYGFPLPVRAERDERLYPQPQVEQLRLIKRLIGNGLRPAKVVGLGVDELNVLLADVQTQQPSQAAHILPFIQLIKTHQASALRIALGRALLQQGLDDFLSKTITPLNQLVGEAWMRGEMRIFEEHLYSEQITLVLRNAISTLRDADSSPRVLLTTLPGEEHSLGLLMAEATLSLYGASCVTLGVQTPTQEIVSAVAAHRSDIVVLSFSEAIPAQQVKTGLQQVRVALPAHISLWAGGSGVARQRVVIEGVQLMGPLSDLGTAVEQWRNTSVPLPHSIS
ncbi:MAG: MerR family transcriptional regulator [Sideroxydans sp.]|nr:MerR family transcriptional regulator [Sideroxydans sp.]